MIFNLFSIPIYNCQLNFDNKKIEKYCYDLKEKDKGRVISNEGGWQSNSLDGYIPDLNELLIEILGRTNSFAKDIGLKTPMKLINGWVNINGYKDYNVEHNHPNSLLSAVYYVKTNDKSGDLAFKNPASDVMAENLMDATVNEYTEYTSSRKYLSPSNGMLYIFPAYLNHHVYPNLSNADRISIAVNFIKDNG